MTSKYNFYNLRAVRAHYLVLGLWSLVFGVGDAYAAMRAAGDVSSRSYAGAYQQVAAIQQTGTVAASADLGLPVRVADSDLAASIARGTDVSGTTVSDLDACAAIYPTGVFAWDIPNSGLKSGAQTPVCVSVVEMRAIQGSGDVLLATAMVSAGDSIDCNIGKFPESTYTENAGKITFPADKEPTIADVRKVMDAEQKKNSGFKIAAGAIVGALAGNAAAKGDVGNDSLLGTSGNKIQGSLIGAGAGALVMTGATQAGKVGGDVIMSAGVNAAAGGAIGNMMASGESVLFIENCAEPDSGKCLWGIIEKKRSLTKDGKAGQAYYNINNADTVVCFGADGKSECEQSRLIGFKFPDNTYDSVESAAADNSKKLRVLDNQSFLCNGKISSFSDGCNLQSGDKSWIAVQGGGFADRAVSVLIKDIDDKFFGLKGKDWPGLRKTLAQRDIFQRNAMGQATSKLEDPDVTIDDFYPLYRDASDGKLIDIGNKARMKSTVVGAGAGAGLGAVSAYSGANDEINLRWVSAVQEYKDSLQKIYCATGKRHLASYNDTAIIPSVK